MDPLSITVATTALVGAASQLLGCVNDVRTARKDLQRWKGDIEGLSILLAQLRDRLQLAQQSPGDVWYQGFLRAMQSEESDEKIGHNAIEVVQRKEQFKPGSSGLFGRLQQRLQELLSDLQIKKSFFKGIGQRLKYILDKADLIAKIMEIRELKKDLDSVMALDHFNLTLDIRR